MPTKQFEPLLNRDLRKVEAKEIIEIASPLLQEEINYATNAFQRCQEATKGAAPDEPLPVLVSYYHVIGMTDGIEVLVSQSCAVPSIPLLRSSFEALLTIEYILKEDCKRRAFAWLVCYVHTRLNLYEMMDTSHQRGKEFLAALAKDGLDKYMNFQSPPNITKAIQNLQSLLGNPNYEIGEDEYQRIKSIRKRPINWYNLFSGPSNLRELSKYLNRWSEYDFLYRYWSNIVHVGDLSHFLTRTKTGSSAFRSIRNHEELAQVAKFAASFILDATRLMLNKYRSGEATSFRRWYISEIRDRYLSL